MDLHAEKIGNVTMIGIPLQFLDASNAKEFKEGMSGLIESHSRVVLDLEQVQFIDSSGCGALLTCLKQLTASGGDLKMCNPTKPVRALFDLVRMHRIVEVLKTREEAVQAFAKPSDETGEPSE